MRVENPWWAETPRQTDKVYRDMRPRACIQSFAKLVEVEDVRRAVVLMGPRRVGKTVLLQHIIQKLLDKGVSAKSIAYLSIDQPLYSNLSMEELAARIREASGLKTTERVFLFLDEVQYLKDWEIHLKVFVDSFPHIKCIVSGSAAAALRLKSIESGAGRFTDFFLPPLTFYEYLDLQEISPPFEHESGPINWVGTATDIEEINKHFIRYIKIGGYPETIFSETIRQNISRYVGSDIIEKVLLHDLPSLYGIQDIQELKSLFVTLAWHTAQEVSLDGLSQQSGVTKPTIKRYMEYLEAAFLIKIVHRIDRNAKRFKRVNNFKVYLTNPSIHYALFGQGEEEQEEPSGALVETAVFAQYLHLPNYELHYARWQSGEVDFVKLDERGNPISCIEVKWSDKDIEKTLKRGALQAFLKKHPGVKHCSFTTRTKFNKIDLQSHTIRCLPVSVHCYIVGLLTAPDFSI